MKVLSLLATIAFFSCTAFSQTLFTYGSNAVSKEEFLKAYNKNKIESPDKEKALREYVELYSKFKLKVKAAKDLQLDTLPQLRSDLENFRNQVSETYMNNENSMNELVNEAADNAAKDMHVGHFFIAAAAGISKEDSLKAANAIQEIYSKLNSGEKDYDKLVQDISAKYTAAKWGDIGYITAFTLPYEYEKIIYALKTGGVSKPYKTQKGWHVFKLFDERKNPGKWRAAQILLAVSPDKGNFQDQQHLADSLYSLLKNGADFADIAKRFSNDKITYMAGGELQEFTSGRYDQDFEKAVFKLAKDNDISKPFLTSYGFHIVKRLSVRPIPADKNDPSYRYELKQKILQDSRVNTARDLFNQSVYKLVAYKRNTGVKDADLFRWADSTVANPAAFENDKFPVRNNVVYSFGKSNLMFRDWLRFIREYKPNPELYHGETNEQLLQKFVNLKSLEYYREHLDEYNAEFRSQLDEFKEGNLLFEIMERKVWSTAAADTAGLKKYYLDNKAKYIWAASADILIFNCGNKKAADEAQAALKKGKSWKLIADESNNTVQSDSGRYEMTQIVLPEKMTPSAGVVTPVIINPSDGTAAFMKIIRLHAAGEQRSFEEARGMVINDYQNVIEEKWIDELKKKYPVKLDETVFQTLLK